MAGKNNNFFKFSTNCYETHLPHEYYIVDCKFLSKLDVTCPLKNQMDVKSMKSLIAQPIFVKLI